MPMKMTRWHFFIPIFKKKNHSKKNCQFYLHGTISERLMKRKYNLTN